ncbi:MAG: 5-oxoprolinase/urea amidolyase family protein [Rhizobiaceae bacterium]|nr:5-oxoprolinase/urea amidolyase family protein [Rhizobiaceae bacterium]
MNTARIRINHAGPYVTFQDGGRPGHMRFGVSASGPMDRASFTAANLSIGNKADATTIEVSMGGLSLECISGDITLAICGGEFSVELGEEVYNSSVVLTIKVGQHLSIRPGKSGSWCYLAIAGQVDVPQWLGKSATHALSGFGGGVVTPGLEFDVLNSRAQPEFNGPIPTFQARKFGRHLRVVLGPQEQYFTPEALKQFLGSEFTLSDAYDRMGVRLKGPSLKMNGALSIPSEPILKGSIQVAGDGVPTILLADHQTTGGYPKIATVISADIDDFVQLRPRQKIRFHAVDPKQAIMLARIRAIELRSYFEALSR